MWAIESIITEIINNYCPKLRKIHLRIDTMLSEELVIASIKCAKRNPKIMFDLNFSDTQLSTINPIYVYNCKLLTPKNLKIH